MATRWERRGTLVMKKGARMGDGYRRHHAAGRSHDGHARITARGMGARSASRCTSEKSTPEGEFSGKEPYAWSSISRCGMAATIAGQATMATKMRATRISCIADSFRQDF